MITQFTVACSRTINLGNFESLRVEASVVIAITDGESFYDMKQMAQGELRKLMEETYRSQYEDRKKIA
jgi:hypothetical protein